LQLWLAASGEGATQQQNGSLFIQEEFLMSDYVDTINYDKLIEKALRHVIHDTLQIVEKQGLPGEHHFYITFNTSHPKVVLEDMIKQQYPQEMTIVLQNQFKNLTVTEDGFDVTLYFKRIPCPMHIPFAAITYFGDPSVKMGLSFGSEIDTTVPPTEKSAAEVISIDAFRKKKNA